MAPRSALGDDGEIVIEMVPPSNKVTLVVALRLTSAFAVAVNATAAGTGSVSGAV